MSNLIENALSLSENKSWSLDFNRDMEELRFQLLFMLFKENTLEIPKLVFNVPDYRWYNSTFVSFYKDYKIAYRKDLNNIYLSIAKKVGRRSLRKTKSYKKKNRKEYELIFSLKKNIVLSREIIENFLSFIVINI